MILFWNDFSLLYKVDFARSSGSISYPSLTTLEAPNEYDENEDENSMLEEYSDSEDDEETQIDRWSNTKS